MKQRTLGNTGLKLTELGFGASGIGGLYRSVSREVAFETMEAAWDAGIRYFDTAPFYGFGLSERRVGDFLRDRQQDEYVISTKVGKLLKPVPPAEVPDHGFVEPLSFAIDFDYSYDAILKSFEFSLARLGLNRVDILYVHDLEIRSLGAEAYRSHFRDFMNGGIAALNELKASNTIGAFGLGLNEVEACLNVINRVPVDCILLAGRYTLLDRTAEAQLLDACRDQNIAIVIGGVFNSGILATGAVPGAHFQYEKPTADIIRRVNALQKIAESAGIDLASAAIKFPLRNTVVTSVLLGTAKASSIGRSAASFAAAVPAELWQAFDQFALRQ